MRALDAAFGGFITAEQTFDNAAIAGEEIYRLDEDPGLILTSFVPVAMAEPELVDEYERAGKKAGNTHLGYLPPDDRVFRGGPTVSARRILGRDN